MVSFPPWSPILAIIASHNYRGCTCQRPTEPTASVHCSHFKLHVLTLSVSSLHTIECQNWKTFPLMHSDFLTALNQSVYQVPISVECYSILHCLEEKWDYRECVHGNISSALHAAYWKNIYCTHYHIQHCISCSIYSILHTALVSDCVHGNISSADHCPLFPETGP